MEAGEAGADYVAFGAFYPTTTKESMHRPDPAILGWWSTLFEIPSVAIGGITPANARPLIERSEEHTSELQSLMRISYAVFCLKKKKCNATHRQRYTKDIDNLSIIIHYKIITTKIINTVKCEYR